MVDPSTWKVVFVDHDDTSVASNKGLHHPAHCECIRRLRPDLQPCTVEEWVGINHSPGFIPYLKTLFTEEQIEQVHAIREEFFKTAKPSFFDGFLPALQEFQRAGGKVVVVTLSPVEMVMDHYESATDFRPDLVYGGDPDPLKVKPNPFPITDALAKLNLHAAHAAVLDDMVTGVKLARNAGVPVVGAGWAHNIPAVRQQMVQGCDAFCETVEEFAGMLGQATAALRGQQ
mmetsp:Transcript_65032/g.149214  ORF Transcript_65032/g.149214 Transcript_65032/m.149214 type:complete len:230 (+) Transcript_65032:24-713(+)